MKIRNIIEILKNEGWYLTVYHFRGHDSLSLAVFNGIVLWGAADQTGTGYRVPLAFESDMRSGSIKLDNLAKMLYLTK